MRFIVHIGYNVKTSKGDWNIVVWDLLCFFTGDIYFSITWETCGWFLNSED